MYAVGTSLSAAGAVRVGSGPSWLSLFFEKLFETSFRSFCFRIVPRVLKTRVLKTITDTCNICRDDGAVFSRTQTSLSYDYSNPDNWLDYVLTKNDPSTRRECWTNLDHV